MDALGIQMNGNLGITQNRSKDSITQSEVCDRQVVVVVMVVTWCCISCVVFFLCQGQPVFVDSQFCFSDSVGVN